MALPQASDMNKYDGKKFTSADWDGNVDATISFLSSGNYDLKVGDIDCDAITAQSINLPATASIPSGTIVPYAATESYKPEGWELCDGRNLDIATNEELFYILGGAYGKGDATQWNSQLGPYTTANGGWSATSIVNDICTIEMPAAHGLNINDYVALTGWYTPTNTTNGAITAGYKVLTVPTPTTFTVSVEGMTRVPDTNVPALSAMIQTWATMTTFTLPDTRQKTLVGGPVPYTSTVSNRAPGSGSATYPDFARNGWTYEGWPNPEITALEMNAVSWSTHYGAPTNTYYPQEQDATNLSYEVTGGQYLAVQHIIKL